MTQTDRSAIHPVGEPNPTEGADGLKRGLGNRHLQMIALGGAIGTGLFMGSGKTIHLAGPSILLIYVIIGFFLFFLMRAMGELLLSNLRYKSFRDVAEDKLGAWAGFFSGWTYWFCWIVIGMSDLIAVTSYVTWWFPNCPLWIPAVLLVALLLGLNAVAVRLFGEIEFWFAIIKIVAIVALIVVAVGMVIIGFQSPSGSHASVMNILNLEHGGWFPNGILGFLTGFQIAFYAFVGIELAGTASAETKDPHRTLPKAINAIPIRIVFFYVFALMAILAVTPWEEINPEISPFVNMFALTGLGVAAAVINFVVLTSAASSMNSGIYSTSRMLFGLSLTRLAPKAFARLSKSSVPVNALVFSCLCVLPGVVLLYASDSIMDAFTYGTTLASVLFIFVWTLIMVSYLVYRKKTPELHRSSSYKVPFGVPMSYVVLGFFVVMLVILGLDIDTLIPMAIAPVWFIILGVAYAIRKQRAAKSGLQIGSAEHSDQE
ncbi:amino acid permease [Propionicicella superfundia]|uniref:amino acid permease n=1 Tax=Propionicicella superfundia TaxID=348582 RepID=UPI00040A8F1E|nr:amino acid permease [Propionicicella superfundia]